MAAAALLESYAGLPLCIGAVFGAQRLVRTGDTLWYRRVVKPSWHPPFWMFPAMWIPLKLMQSIALWLVLGRIRTPVTRDSALFAVAVFAVHVFLGCWWNVVFFGKHRIAESVPWMLTFWTSVVATAGACHAVAPAAGYLVAPTIGWVTAATALNIHIWRLNPKGVPEPTAAERAAFEKEQAAKRDASKDGKRK